MGIRPARTEEMLPLARQTRPETTQALRFLARLRSLILRALPARQATAELQHARVSQTRDH